ncbi:6480_t:CDS:2, partial [Gigaspora rosea]
QKKAADEIKNNKKKLAKLEQIYSISTDSELRLDFYKKLVDVQDNIKNNKEMIGKLQRNARYAQSSSAADEKRRKSG